MSSPDTTREYGENEHRQDFKKSAVKKSAERHEKRHSMAKKMAQRSRIKPLKVIKGHAGFRNSTGGLSS